VQQTRSTARPQQARLFLLLFARSVSSAPTRANQRDKHSPAKPAKENPLAQQQAVPPRALLHSTVSSFVRLRFCPSPPPSTSLSHNHLLLLAYRHRSLLSQLLYRHLHIIPHQSFFLPLLARTRNHSKSTVCLDAAAHTHARALIRPRAPPLHRTLRHRARSPCPRPRQTLPWS
jgi:hypothetical protein